MKIINLIKISFFDEYLSKFVAGTKRKKYVVLNLDTENFSACEENV